MTTTIYGQSCLGIPDSKGELVPYLFRSVPPSPFARRAWTLTKPDGAEYRCEEIIAGSWRCSCPDWKYRGRVRDCKHLVEIQNHLKEEGASCDGT